MACVSVDVDVDLDQFDDDDIIEEVERRASCEDFRAALRKSRIGRELDVEFLDAMDDALWRARSGDVVGAFTSLSLGVDRRFADLGAIATRGRA